MISVQDALAIIHTHRPMPKGETVQIARANHRVLMEDVTAKINMPPFASSNMDGYAVSDCQTGDRIKVIGESAAGHPFNGPVKRGTAVRISTGAMMPQGADRVLMQEQATLIGDVVKVKTAPVLGKHIRSKASDFAVGTPLLKSGQRLEAADLTLLAAAGHAEVQVRRRLKLAIFSTGDELQPTGATLSEGEIYASNTIGLKPLLEKWGAEVTDLGILRDSPEALTELCSSLEGYDIIVPIGGASIGKHDHMRPSFRAAGYDILFEKIAVRPGKPSWMAKKDNMIVFGLAGNPASAFVCAHIFLRPLLGLKTRLFKAALSKNLDENGPHETYLRAIASLNQGHLQVTPELQQDSYRLRPQSNANAFIKIPPLGGPYRQGETLDILLIDELVPTE